VDVTNDTPDSAVVGPSPSRPRVLAAFAVAAASSIAALALLDDPLTARALAVAAVYLTFALSEVAPPFVPTLVLLVSIPVVLGVRSSSYQLPAVLSWGADPVLGLFAGGFALGLAAARHGLDGAFASALLRAAGRSQRGLVAVVLLAAVGTSMWLSNVAAAALLLAALRPILSPPTPPALRRAALVALAVGANLGGMATPIGSGPNGIAIAATRHLAPITFLSWMSFGVPLVLGMSLLAWALISLRYGVRGDIQLSLAAPAALTPAARRVCAVFACAVAAWLTEPLHHISAPTVALGLMLVLFASGLLGKSDLGALDWSTLGLIAGGLILGRLLETSGVLHSMAGALAQSGYPRWVWLGGLVSASALLAALMSNTATAALLIPLGLELDATPATAILIAVATSFGMPFPISTPPNAMVYGTGAVRTSDLLQIGLVVMVIGCVLVTFTGSWFLRLLGFG